MFYNYCTDVPDAQYARRRLLPSASGSHKYNHAINGGFHAVKSVNGIGNEHRKGEAGHV
ncbi:hypothetical protein SJI19_14370 [Acerihabitans sp. TG2]|uniref:hypothetical protein n=1 Tax=Acerihabitans sp. TG2 TaxID=3096008 RepID=UPI002B22EBDD|nr:hypothetical protein [Acerihabitans sp. TG2]MEA9391713.1 hypothetical protein [Acerihabitans sp. TG2]